MHMGDKVRASPRLNTNCTAKATGIASNHTDGPMSDRHPVVQGLWSVKTPKSTIAKAVIGRVNRNSMKRELTERNTHISRGKLDAVTSFASLPSKRPESPSTWAVHWKGKIPVSSHNRYGCSRSSPRETMTPNTNQ